LAWFERLIAHAESLYASAHPAILAGDFNVVPTDFDIYNPKSWKKDALVQPESRAAYQRLLMQGWVDSLRAPRAADIYVLGLFSKSLAAQRGAAHRSCAPKRCGGIASYRRKRRYLGTRPAACVRPRANMGQVVEISGPEKGRSRNHDPKVIGRCVE